MTNKEFVSKLLDVMKNKTLYVMGSFGSPMSAINRRRYIAEYVYNSKPERAAKINAADNSVFGFDCVNLIKAVLWGWTGDHKATYGGAKYKSNNVPDIGANEMISRCVDVKTSEWDNITLGEAVWLQGHIGVYVGDGLVIEATPKWSDGVQLTALLNIGPKAGYNGRTWTKHGKLPYIEYVPTDSGEYKVGDTVHFKGGKHYSSGNGLLGYNVGAGDATITIINKSKKHPYHIIHTKSSPSKVYGWVDENTIERR